MKTIFTTALILSTLITSPLVRAQASSVGTTPSPSPANSKVINSEENTETVDTATETGRSDADMTDDAQEQEDNGGSIYPRNSDRTPTGEEDTNEIEGDNPSW